jgi:hypothetical protein
MWWILVLTLVAFVIDVVCSVALLGREPATRGGSRVIEFPHYRRVA